MAEENTGAPCNDSDNSIIPVTATTEYVDEPTDQAVHAPGETGHTGNINKEPPSIVVNLPPEDKRHKRNEVIAIWVGVVIQVILAYFTYLLFTKTVEANNESIRANNIAQQALDDSRINQRKNDFLDSIVRRSDFVRDTTNTGLGKQSLQAQINSVKDAQVQFEIGNEPYLQISIPTFATPWLLENK